MIRLLRSTSVRLALGYSLLFILSSGLLVGVLWWRMTDYLDRATDAAIVSDTQAIGDRFGDFGLPGAIETIAERVVRAADERAIYLLTDPRLTRIAGNLAAWPLEVERRAGWYQVRLVRADRQHATRFLHLVLPGNYHLLVGRDVEDRVALRGLILGGLGWTAGASLLLAILGGLLVRRAVLRRIEEITGTANGIVRGDLAQRLPIRGTDDEFDQLALTINGMLEQIQQLIENIQNTSNAIAHDLRTPLAELRGRLEELQRVQPSTEASAQEIQGAVADVDRVIGIFNALLRLAEIDSGVRRSGFHKVELAELVADAAELYRPSLEERGATLTLDAPIGPTVEGDPFLLAQAIGNLLDNAAKVAPAGSTVILSLAAHGPGEIAIAVADRGPGIPEAEKARVTERFFRGDSSRGTAGSGLGLSLVDAVARLHGGRLDLADNAPGLVARLVLPHSGG